MIKTSARKKITVGEPNLIPLLDFLLVLIVMFVLLAGPIRQAIELPLPEVKPGSSRTVPEKALQISIKDKNNFYINDKHFSTLDQVEQYLTAQTSMIKEITVAIDKTQEVDLLMKVFAITKNRGISTANIQINQTQ